MLRFKVKNDSVKMSVGNNNIGMTVEKAAFVGGINYEGSYEVTPTVDGETLKTAQTFLEKDIKINKIPYFEVNNNSGGNTVYIANEV